MRFPQDCIACCAQKLRSKVIISSSLPFSAFQNLLLAKLKTIYSELSEAREQYEKSIERKQRSVARCHFIFHLEYSL